MAIKFNCPKCGKKVGVPETAAGKTGKCPGCGTTLTVPKTPAPPPVRPDKQGATDYNFRLSDEDRARIEAEEHFHSKETPPCPISSPIVRSRVVTFDCTYCFREITITAVPGATCRCPSCQQTVKVPSTSKAVDALSDAPRDSRIPLRVQTCHACRSDVAAEATRCRHCGEDLRASWGSVIEWAIERGLKFAASACCIIGGAMMLMTEPVQQNSLFAPLLHGIGLYCIGRGLAILLTPSHK